jgi:vacuolar protein sorting-associated protein 3
MRYRCPLTLFLLQTDELHYVYQRIGFQCLFETMFEDAGRHLFSGDIDPRILVSYFPDLRGSLISQTDSVNMFAGVADHLPTAYSIDDLSKPLFPFTSIPPPFILLRK